jgi:hypothetical protein
MLYGTRLRIAARLQSLLKRARASDARINRHADDEVPHQTL